MKSTSAERCDRIIALIDSCLAEYDRIRRPSTLVPALVPVRRTR